MHWILEWSSQATESRCKLDLCLLFFGQSSHLHYVNHFLISLFLYISVIASYIQILMNISVTRTAEGRPKFFSCALSQELNEELLEIGDENANDDVDTNLYSREISVATDE